MSMTHHFYSGQNAEKVFSTHHSYKIQLYIVTYQVKLEKPDGFLKLTFWNYIDQKLFS